MSDTLRDLVVALSLDASQFDKNIRLVNRQLKEAESEFTLAAAGVEDFEKTLSGMAAKAQYLQKQLEGQNRIVGQYTQKLAKANEDLTNATMQHDRLRERLEREKRARDDLGVQLTNQQRILRDTIRTYGEGSDEAQEAAERMADLSMEYREAQDQVKKTTGQVTAQERVVRKAAETIEDTTTNLNNAKAAVKQLTKEVALNTNSWYTHGVAMQKFAEDAEGASRRVEQIGGVMTRTMTVPLATMGVTAAKAAIDYESAFAGVRKTVNVTGRDADEFFDGLSQSIQKMSTELATSAVDIAEVTAIAGQLGIANEQLAEFTDVVVRLGMSTNLAGEEAASSMARFANITGMAQSQFGNMGAALVYLGNNFATTEREIMNMATRIAAAGAQVGLSEAEILGFAAALSSLGLEAEAGGSAFSKALRMMEVAAATNSDSLEDFAKVAGLTRQEFAALWQSKPAEAFQAFIVGLSKMDEEGIGAIATLDEINITELRLSDTLLRSANATEILSSAQEGANQAWADGAALLKESEMRLQTTESRLTNLKNSVVQVGVQFGGAMLPQIEEGVQWLSKLVGQFVQMDDAAKRSIITWGAYTAASGIAVSALGKIGSAITATVGVVGKMSEAIGKANVVFKETHSIGSWLGKLLGPGGAVVAGVAVSAAAIAGLIALMNRVNRSKVDFSLDAEDIDRLAIDVSQLQADIEVNTSTEITGDVLSLKDKFIDILNDGVPETQEIRNEMKGDVDEAVGAAYALIEETYIEKQAALDDLFAQGIIDEATYTQLSNSLKGQTDDLRTDLTVKADAVTGYVGTLCAQNRSMTDEEIKTLNDLLEQLGMVTQKVEQAEAAQMHIYELAKTRTRLGMADEDEQKLAMEGVELEYAQKLAAIEAQKQVLRASYGAQMAEAGDEEDKALSEKLENDLAALDRSQKLIEQQKMAEYMRLLPGLTGGITAEQIHEWAQQIEMLKNWWENLSPQEQLDEAAVLSAFNASSQGMAELEKEVSQSGILEEGSPLSILLATLTEQGLIAEEAVGGWQSALLTLSTLTSDTTTQAGSIMPGATQAVEDSSGEFVQAVQDAADDAADVLPETFDMHSPSRLMYTQGSNIMAGLRNGIRAGRSSVVREMRIAARAAVNAAKSELKIQSPSRVFEEEVGAMAMKGFGRGFLRESEAQAKVIRNAARYLTGAAADGAAYAADNRKTYHNTSSVNVTGNTFIIRDKQDIESLSMEIALLGEKQQRGRGVK